MVSQHMLILLIQRWECFCFCFFLFSSPPRRRHTTCSLHGLRLCSCPDFTSWGSYVCCRSAEGRCAGAQDAVCHGNKAAGVTVCFEVLCVRVYVSTAVCVFLSCPLTWVWVGLCLIIKGFMYALLSLMCHFSGQRSQ